MDRLWFTKNYLYRLLLPLSWIYGGLVRVRRFLYQIGLLRRYTAPVPVFVVGNLSVGGNGKTPVVLYLAQQLSAKGLSVGIISRGYGGRSDHYPFVIDDQTTAAEAGDEPILLYRRLRCPIAIAPQRAAAIQALMAAHPEIDLILADDGMQHYALQRDLEIVVIDGRKGFGNGAYLPAGPLRETPNRLNDQQLVVINGQPSTELSALLARRSITTYEMQLIASDPIQLTTETSAPIATLHSVVACAGIGDPQRFFTTLHRLGVTPLRTLPLPDHYRYPAQEVAQFATADETLLMTEKDAVKCVDFAQPNWWYLPIEAHFPPEFLDSVMARLEHCQSHPIAPHKR